MDPMRYPPGTRVEFTEGVTTQRGVVDTHQLGGGFIVVKVGTTHPKLWAVREARVKPAG